jgi:hypothetical protein
MESPESFRAYSIQSTASDPRSTHRNHLQTTPHHHLALNMNSLSQIKKEARERHDHDSGMVGFECSDSLCSKCNGNVDVFIDNLIDRVVAAVEEAVVPTAGLMKNDYSEGWLHCRKEVREAFAKFRNETDHEN